MSFKTRFSAIVVLMLASIVAFGQAVSGDLIGTVVDKSGAVVPNATVTAMNQATNVKSTTTTNNSGEYRFNNLAIGRYTVTASANSPWCK